MRRERDHYQLKHSLAQLRLHSLAQTQPALPLEGENKQLYFQYMEEVLQSKEQELIELEEQLQERTAALDAAEGKQRLLNPLALSHQAEALARQAEMLAGMLGEGGRSEVAKGMRVVEEACRQSHLGLQEEVMREYGELGRERRELGERLSKLGELERYEKYLVELQRSLEAKEYGLMVR